MAHARQTVLLSGLVSKEVAEPRDGVVRAGTRHLDEGFAQDGRHRTLPVVDWMWRHAENLGDGSAGVCPLAIPLSLAPAPACEIDQLINV